MNLSHLYTQLLPKGFYSVEYGAKSLFQISSKNAYYSKKSKSTQLK